MFDEPASGWVAARVRPGALLQISNNNNNKYATKADISKYRIFFLIRDNYIGIGSETVSFSKIKAKNK